MRVQSITVDGYKSFGKTNNMLQVNPGTTTIVGMNGAGKSNLMDVIGSIDLVSGMKMQGWQDKRNHALTQPITITVLLSPSENDDCNVTGQGRAFFGEAYHLKNTMKLLTKCNGYKLTENGSVVPIDEDYTSLVDLIIQMKSNVNNDSLVNEPIQKKKIRKEK